jgi:hypothetical protein
MVVAIVKLEAAFLDRVKAGSDGLKMGWWGCSGVAE